MAKASPWPIIHAERKSLAADLDDLDVTEWARPSLCAEWSVRELLAHMTATARMTAPTFFAQFIASGFRFNEMADKNVVRELGDGPADTLARFRSQLTATRRPPGPIDAMLGEIIVHAEDIRRPLGIAHTYPVDAVVRAASFYKGSNLIVGAKRRIAGLALRATDVAWSTGSGPEVSGPAIALLLAMTGRHAALDDLEGDGVTVLRGRS